jgi:hypothetical protein
MTTRCSLCGSHLPDDEQPVLGAVVEPIDSHRKARRSDSATAKKAAKNAEPRQGTQRFRCLDAIASFRHGLTYEEVARETRLPAVSCSTRMSELLTGGFVERSGQTRKTLNGGDADCLVVTAKGMAVLQQHDRSAA